MNIFFLDYDPALAAKYHFDGHVVKMVLESLQILCTVLRQYRPRLEHECLMKATHQHHPCVKWAGASFENYSWLVKHCEALFKEYTKRYGRKHASETRFHTLRSEFEACSNHVFNAIGIYSLTKAALVMPEECKTFKSVDSYRLYYSYKQDVDYAKMLENNLLREQSSDKVRKYARKMVWVRGKTPQWALKWNK
jgi:hypothetical protein